MKRLVFLSVFILASNPALAAEPAAKSAHPPGHQMEPAKEAASAAIEHCGLPMGAGVISALDVAKSRATIAHGPVPALGWDDMTMGFSVARSVDLAAFAAGDRVHFLLAPGKKAKSQDIAAMCAADAETGAHEACMGVMHQTAMTIAAAAGKPCEGMDHSAMGHGDAAKPASDHSNH